MSVKIVETKIDISKTLIAIEQDLMHLGSVQEDLLYNINFLKQENIVTIISEYKKTIEQLKRIKQLIIEIKNMKLALQEKLDKEFKNNEYNYLNVEFKEPIKSNIIKFRRRVNE
jgi:predicted phage-related endonuclease